MWKLERCCSNIPVTGNYGQGSEGKSMNRSMQIKSSVTWRVCITIAIVGLLCLMPSIASAYAGFLTVNSGGLSGDGFWADGGLPTFIAWYVAFDYSNYWWNYTYWFGHPLGATSHLILQASPNFGSADIFNASGFFGSYDVGDFEPGPDNPGMPDSIHGIRFNDTFGIMTKIHFSSYRVPVWGDFFAVGEDYPTGEGNAAWNSGFTGNDTDPFAPPTNCGYRGHLLVPDGVTTVVPEPATLLLLGGGLLALAGMHSRRRS